MNRLRLKHQLHFLKVPQLLSGGRSGWLQVLVLAVSHAASQAQGFGGRERPTGEAEGKGLSLRDDESRDSLCVASSRTSRASG